jgi:hypothetical protein
MGPPATSSETLSRQIGERITANDCEADGDSDGKRKELVVFAAPKLGEIPNENGEEGECQCSHGEQQGATAHQDRMEVEIGVVLWNVRRHWGVLHDFQVGEPRAFRRHRSAGNATGKPEPVP